MIFIDEREGAVGLDAIREIGIAAGDKNQIAFEHAVFVDGAGAVDASMETVICAEFRKDRTFGENLCRGGRHEEFIGVEGIKDFAGVERIEFDAEIGVSEFGTVNDLLDTLRE